MPILSEEIDPALSLALKERMEEIVSTRAGDEPELVRLRVTATNRWRETIRRNSYHFWGAGACLLGSIAAIPMLAPNGPWLTVSALLGIQAVGVGLVRRGFGMTRASLTRFVDADVMRNAGKLIALSPIEQLYCGCVASLIDGERALTEPASKEILAQLNGLLTNFRNLEAQARPSPAGQGSHGSKSLEDELSDLVRRRDATPDALARAMMDESIALCRQRLRDAEAVAPLRAQAEAQQALIHQAMASIQACLSRIANADSVALPADVAELQGVVDRLNREASSVEEAVLEVGALRN